MGGWRGGWRGGKEGKKERIEGRKDGWMEKKEAGGEGQPTRVLTWQPVSLQHLRKWKNIHHFQWMPGDLGEPWQVYMLLSHKLAGECHLISLVGHLVQPDYFPKPMVDNSHKEGCVQERDSFQWCVSVFQCYGPERCYGPECCYGLECCYGPQCCYGPECCYLHCILQCRHCTPIHSQISPWC